MSRSSPSVATEPQDDEEYPSLEDSQDQRHHYVIHDSYELMNIHEENGYDDNGVYVEEWVVGELGAKSMWLMFNRTVMFVWLTFKCLRFGYWWI